MRNGISTSVHSLLPDCREGAEGVFADRDAIVADQLSPNSVPGVLGSGISELTNNILM